MKSGKYSGSSRPPLFASDRERRLWTWTLVVVVGIYATLGLARAWAGMLRDRNLLDSSFALGMLLIAAAVVMQGLRRRPGGVEIGVALGIAGAYLIMLVRMAIPEERTHLIEYSLVALLIYEALTERAGQGRRVPAPALLAVTMAAAVGVLDEAIQAALPSRVFDPRDILFNVLAVVMAVAASAALGWARRRAGK